MTRTVVNTKEAMVRSLEEIVKNFEQAQRSVFNLMASVSLFHFTRYRYVAKCMVGFVTEVHP